MFDYLIIGAGVSGSTLAHFLSLGGSNNVALIDKAGIAGGASGAAGAFLAPKVAKGGYLLELVNKSFVYALSFYEKFSPELLTKYGLLHSASQDFEKIRFIHFAKTHSTWLSKPKLFTELKKEFYEEALFFNDGALIESRELCKKLSNGCTFINENIKNLEFNEHWILNNRLKAKVVILATGYENILNEEVIKIRPILGQRCDITSSTKIPYNLHSGVSVSATKKNGEITIGATHHREFTEIKATKEDNIELLNSASTLVTLKNIEIKNSFVGVRAGSFDYLPLLGKVVNSSKTLLKFPSLLHKHKAKIDELVYYPNLYVINGVGGRGFVLAPFLAKILSEHLLNDKNLDKELLPSRFFYRWCKKNGATWKK